MALLQNSSVHKGKAFRKCFVTLINVEEYVGNFQLKSIISEYDCFRTDGNGLGFGLSANSNGCGGRDFLFVLKKKLQKCRLKSFHEKLFFPPLLSKFLF